jgi:hypothetical protein
MFFNGSDAVSFFFVLSGFVLSYKYFQTAKEKFQKIKRFEYKKCLKIKFECISSTDSSFRRYGTKYWSYLWFYHY